MGDETLNYTPVELRDVAETHLSSPKYSKQ